MTILAKVAHIKPIIKKNKQRSLTLIPYFFTFANAILGLLAVFKALDCEYIAAAYCILLAAFFDVLDGRVARALGTSSILGMELDSLSDAISFCVAPVVLLYSYEVQDFGTLGFIVLAIYLCSGIFRLAKFNINSANQNNFFSGLPTPVAAFFLTTLVLYHDWLQVSPAKFLLYKYVLFALLIFISFLMISKIKFPAFKQNKLRKSFYILFACLFVSFFIFRDYPLLMFLVLLYILSGCSHGCYLGAKRLKCKIRNNFN